MSAILKTPSVTELVRYAGPFRKSGNRPCHIRVGLGLSIGSASFGGYTSLTPATFDFDPTKGIRFGATMRLISGTGTTVFNVSGTRDRTATQLLSGGIRVTIEAGATTMTISYDNGATTVATGVAIPAAGGTYTLTGVNSDLTLTRVAGTVVAGDTHNITVEQWTDQVGGYIASNSTNVLQQPLYFVTGLAGKPYLDFDGTDDRLVCTSASVFNVFKDSATFTLIQRLASDTPNSVRCAFGAASSLAVLNNSRRFGTNAVNSGAANSTWTNNAGTGLVSDASTALGTGARTLSWQANGGAGTLALYTDGALSTITNGTSNTPGTLTPDRAAFGSRPSSSHTTFWDGKIGRHVGFSSVIPDLALWLANL